MKNSVDACSTEVPESGVEHVRSWSGDRHDQHVAVTVSISSLLPSDSPRLSGENIEHARALADSEASFSPIIVNRGNMRGVDRMHRLRAAVFRGQGDIDVQFFDGDTAGSGAPSSETTYTPTV